VVFLKKAAGIKLEEINNPSVKTCYKWVQMQPNLCMRKVTRIESETGKMYRRSKSGGKKKMMKLRKKKKKELKEKQRVL
jgi:hypothetical protein